MSGAVARARALLQRLGPDATLAQVRAAAGEIGLYAVGIAVGAIQRHGRGAAGALRRAEDYDAADSDEADASEPTVPLELEPEARRCA